MGQRRTAPCGGRSKSPDGAVLDRKKLAAKLIRVSPNPLPETSPLGSWHADLFTLDRCRPVVELEFAEPAGG